MGRAPCCDKSKVKKGPWSPEEDATLKNYIQSFGTGGNWITLPSKAGLKRCGKSCRLRWLNYLRPDIKHGGFTDEEDNIIYTLYSKLGSRWSIIASHLPGRTDNDVKNYWNTKLKKKLVINVSKTNSYETTFETPNNTNFTFQNSTFFGSLIPETDSDLSPNISTLLDESSPSMANSYCLNYNYTHNLTYATSSYGDVVSGFCSVTSENNDMLWYGNYSGVSSLGYSENLGIETSREVISEMWSQDINSEFGSFNYPNMGNNFYQGVTSKYLEIED